MLLLLALFVSQLTQAQTTLVNETFEGGSFGTFTVLNGTQTNRWAASNAPGNGPSAAGAGAAHITNDVGTALYAYTTGGVNVSSAVHLYRDVTFPAGETIISLSFDWRGQGEGSWDFLRVYLVSPSYAPLPGTVPAAADGTQLFQLNLQSAYTTSAVQLPSGLAGTTKRLLFTWVNDGSQGAQPPAALDNVRLTSQAPTPMSGTYTIDNTLPASATNFRTFAAAVTSLNQHGVGGVLRFDVAAGQQFAETLPAITATGASSRRVTFVRSGSGPNPVLQTSGTAGIDLVGTDYYTFDGIDVSGNPTYAYRVRSASGTDGAQNNVIKNAAITLTGAANSVGVLQASNGSYGSVSASSTDGLNQGCRYLNLTISKVNHGIEVFSVGSSFPEYDIEIGGCTIGDAGDATSIGNTTSAVAYGIHTFMVRRLSVHDNRVQNVAGQPGNGIHLEYCQGIGTNLTSAPAAGAGNDASNVYNNVVTGIRQLVSTNTNAVYGLYVTTYNNGGHVLNLYNNAVSNVTTPYAGAATATRVVTGLYLSTSGGYGNETNVWHNSVRIDGSDAPTATNTCFELGNSSVSKLNLRNNVFANYTSAQSLAKHYCWITQNSASSVAIGPAGSVSDYNDLYLLNTGNGFIGATGIPSLNSGTPDKATLANWQTATGNQDPHTLTLEPLFASSTLLKPSSAALNNAGASIAAISTDITGATRTTPPDMGAYEFAPAVKDLAVDALVAPGTGTCYSLTDEPVAVVLRNVGTSPITFTPAEPLTVTVQVSGPVTKTMTGTMDFGTVQPNGTAQVQVLGPLPMAAAGTYTFNVSLALPGDGTASNNTLTPVPTRTVLPTAALPQNVDFVGYTGTNLATAFPNWYEATGSTAPAAQDVAWTGSTAFAGNAAARINLYSAAHQDWLVGPKVTPTAGTIFRFKAAVAEYGTAGTTPDAHGGMAATDDALHVMVSTDCGATFTSIFAVSAANGNVPANGGGFADYVVPLGAYAGQQILVALKATDGPVDNTPDYDLHMDDLFIGTPTADVGAVALVAPLAAGCYSATENVTVQVRNYGISPISNVPVQVVVGGALSTTLSTTFAGPIAANATADVVVGQLSLTAAGTYTFVASTQLPGDGVPANDALAQQTRVQNGVAALPQMVTFTGYNGSANLPTLSPGWYEGGTQAAAPTAADSYWTTNSSNQRPAFGETAKVNLYSANLSSWLVGPRVLATATTKLSLRAGTTDYGQATGDPLGMAGTDDRVQVLVSADCGVSYVPVYTFDAAHPVPNNGTLGLFDVPLGAYAGQEIIVALRSSSGTTSDGPDYDFHVDDLYLSNGQGLDLRPVTLALPTVRGCFSNNERVEVTVKNDGTALIDFAVNPITITAQVTVPGGTTRTLSTTLSFGTLGPGGYFDAYAGLLDMSALGTYSYVLSTTVAGDTNPGNDQLATPITRTVTAPSVGSVSPNNASVCENGTVQLTVSNAVNGTIQWQQSGDGTTFTDISGADQATYTTPALTANTWYRVQVRCGSRVATSSIVPVTVGNPRILNTNGPVRRCGPGNVTLTATPNTGGTVRWYAAPTGGPVLSTSTSYTFALAASGTYYVSAVVSGGSGQCESARTAVAVFADDAPTVDAGPAEASLCGTAAYTLAGSIGGGATSAAWTTSGSGTFAPSATALNATYTPSAADRTAGTVTLTLRSTNASGCTAAQDQLVLNLGPTQWTGAVSSDWFDARNWTACVPDAATDAIIPNSGGSLRPVPQISGGTATVRALAFDGDAGLVMTGGTLRVHGNWNLPSSATALLTGGVVEFRSAGDQYITGNVLFANISMIKPAADYLYAVNVVRVNGTLTTTSGHFYAGINPIVLEAGAQLVGESATGYVDGQLKTIANLNAPDVTYTFGGMGLSLTPHGSTLPGLTEVVRTTGQWSSGASLTKGIRRGFTIKPAVDAGLNIDLRFTYRDDELNGLSESRLTLFSAPVSTANWQQLSYSTRDLDANQIGRNGLTHLSCWTLGEGAGPLPISLTSLTAQRQQANAVVRWETAQEQDVLRYEVQVSTNGVQYRTLGTVEPASPSSSSPRSYSFADREAGKQGLRYYRLRQLDLDGTEAFFGPRTVNFDGATASLSAYPNPFGSQLTLRLSAATAQPAALLRLLDANGRLVLTRTVDLPAGASDLPLPGVEQLPSGVYTLLLILDGQPQRLKLVKQ
ncbi:T9SS type A sorting domain-containing protein [Hymenobacter busanensis]|nr:T9SS type A sorting domain-containing protein [Hymenobacter busanensis]QHJ08642.1 T9SS type A sorting domain-containing protein [Hymenobacter busanensis]